MLRVLSNKGCGNPTFMAPQHTPSVKNQNIVLDDLMVKSDLFKPLPYRELK